ncbi:hypothetical protein [Aggregatibacter kilianii]|nr:hypothetical protein [Aggregatibacter kilianii]
MTKWQEQQIFIAKSVNKKQLSDVLNGSTVNLVGCIAIVEIPLAVINLS